MTGDSGHWNKVYAQRRDDALSWHQANPDASLRFIRRCGEKSDAPIIDIGAGASRLPDILLHLGHSDVTALDISAAALEISRKRLGGRADGVAWIVADVTRWTPARRYRIWHDRAVFHFLIDQSAREAYRDALLAGTEIGACIIISTFDIEGPEACCGLPAARYAPETLADAFAPTLRLVEAARENHVTPRGAIQKFQTSRFLRIG